ncbi:NUDIX hydrolase domain-like protein [Trametes maxima]|nr:NUDIX hydrolase domain-like protein [Trametes maxima]
MSLAIQIPPGLQYDGPLVETASGGTAPNWVEYQKVKEYTNAFVIINDTKVLLGYKKRGFGVGLWNGFGGKVDPGETSAQAAVRELEEESGITAPLELCGTLFFVVEGVDTAFNINIFRAYEYSGTITETDEMRPEWFGIQESLLPRSNPSPAAGSEVAADGERSDALPPIPLDKMWADDQFWMPLMFSRRHFVGRADFAPNGTESNNTAMLKYWFGAAPE